MPELVEVEHYLHQFQPLVSTSCPLSLDFPTENPPKVFLSKADIDYLHKGFCITNLERKGKLIRLHLKSLNVIDDGKSDFLYFHMGMTGRISTPNHIPSLESISSTELYPPPHTHLMLKSNGHEISFSDQRKFGSVCLNDNGPLEKQWNDFAIDAMDAKACFSGFLRKKQGIKTLLLDQRAVISGVGNWIADEVLYQCKIHPDQKYLNDEEVTSLKKQLKEILEIGIQCLDDKKDFPDHWIFQSRWSKRKQKNLKDIHGNAIVFIKSAGRTSAIVPTFQLLKGRSGGNKDNSIHNTQSQKRNRDKSKDKMKSKRDTKKHKIYGAENKNEALRRSSRLTKK